VQPPRPARPQRRRPVPVLRVRRSISTLRLCLVPVVFHQLHWPFSLRYYWLVVVCCPQDSYAAANQHSVSVERGGSFPSRRSIHSTSQSTHSKKFATRHTKIVHMGFSPLWRAWCYRAGAPFGVSRPDALPPAIRAGACSRFCLRYCSILSPYQEDRWNPGNRWNLFLDRAKTSFFPYSPLF
jgi:hypothetical protein